jgi:hypothetical protein
MNSKLNKYWKLLLAADIAYLLYVVMLSWMNAPVADDWTFFNALDDKGIFAFQKEMYMTWEGRFSSFFVITLYYAIYKFTNSMIVINMFVYIVGVYSFYLLIKHYLPQFDKAKKMIMSFFAMNIVLVSSMSFYSFFWLCSSSYYLFAFLTIIVFYLIVEKKKAIISYVLIAILSILIGGSAEHYAPMVMLFGGIYWLYLMRNKTDENRHIRNKLLCSLNIMFVSFIIMLEAPGNYVRMAASVRPDGLNEWMVAIAKSYAYLFASLIPSLIEMAFIFIPSMLVGRALKERGIVINAKFSIKKFFISILLLIAFYMFGIAPGIYALAALAPLRAFSYYSVVGVIFFGYWGIVYGYYAESGVIIRRMNLAFGLFASLFIVYSVGKIINDYPRIADYKASMANRIAFVDKLKIEKTDTACVVLPALHIRSYATPELWFYNQMMYLGKSGRTDLPITFYPLPIDEIVNDKNYYSNRAFVKLHNLKFSVMVEKDPLRLN